MKAANKHKHAGLMALFAQDAMETETPWVRWEMRPAEHCSWRPCVQAPSWHPDNEYRRKPKVIMINGHEVPEPLREFPADETVPVFLAEIGTYGEPVTQTNTRQGARLWLEACLKAGLIHATREAAEIHAKALWSFTALKTEGGAA